MKTWSGDGFYENEKGKLKHSANLLVDTVGNILVADNGRGSLCIFEELRLKEIRRPSDIIWQGRTLLVACAGRKTVERAVLRYEPAAAGQRSDSPILDKRKSTETC